MIRATQSLLFAVIYSIYLLVVMLPFQRLILKPLCALNPVRRPAILRWWFRAQADWVLGLAQWPGGLKIESQGGPLPGIPLIVVMNHQSLLDIPAAVSLMRGPYPVIPTRALYTRWIPGISGIANLGGFPSLKQSGRASRAEHAAIVGAAEAVERGERTLIIYPEGHRTKDGELLPFATQGLRLVFRHAHQHPVYVVVIDGAWRLRGFADIALRLSSHRIQIRVLGPYTVPTDRRDHQAFIESLRAQMVATLARLRGRETPLDPATSGVSDVSGVAGARAPLGPRSASVAPHAPLVG